MSHRLTLAEFVEQELRVAEPLFRSLADAVLTQWRTAAPSRLASDMDALRVMHQYRDDFVRHAVQSLREQTQRRADPFAPPAATRPARLELSLVDDDEITADIEIARVVERANSDLEVPLRELRTYTSALVGDINAARETNPLRPEVWVRALMAAARGVPISRPMQIALLRGAAQPLIQALGQTYHDSRVRLQALGVAPATHRTIVNEGVATELTEAMRTRKSLERGPDAYDPYLHGPVDPSTTTDPGGMILDLLQRLEQGLSAPTRPGASTQPPSRGAAPDAFAPSLTADSRPHAGPREQHTVEHLSQLYDAILSDRRLPRDSLPLLSRLYPAVLRQTLAEPDLLDDAGHPVWRFMDHLAFLMQTRAVGDGKANVAFAQGLIEQLIGQRGADARPFQSATDRLAVHDRQRFARAVAAASTDIASLAASLRPTADVPLPPALDAGGPESQPAPLRRGGDQEPAPRLAASSWRAGLWLTLFLRSQWRRALILWRAPGSGPLLLLDAGVSRHWALPTAAIERLAAAGLARMLVPRSLMSDAIGRIGQVSRDPGPTLFG
ncbi:MAG: DUF1631 family protein [Ideonella sp.]|nr:DUF1631 family protein [Ideonella sp.]MCC7457237.1 DUF1631 family protein [Nitrospira sp.]